METSARFKLRRAWVLVWVAAFIFYRLGEVQLWPEHLYFGPHRMLEPLMFFASFPASLFYAVGVEALFCNECNTLTREPLFWMGVLVAGYLQWFRLVPLLFDAKLVTTLNLCTAPHAPTPNVSVSNPSTPAPAHEPPARAPSPAPRLSPPADAARPPVPHFDDRGRTPLGRIIHEEQ